MAIVTQLKGLIGGGGRPAPARRPVGPARHGQGVIRMPSASPRHRQTSAEEQIPLGDATGTYGSF
jgi:hypothetical protein